MVFGHRCTGQPTGDMWPDCEDERALRRRAAVVHAEISELERAINLQLTRRLKERSKQHEQAGS